MLSYLGLSSQPQKKLGDLTHERNIGEQLQELKGKVEKTMTKNKGELQKFRDLTKFNEKITKSYVANLKVIIDISTLLKAYNEFFDMFKNKLAEIDHELGVPISTDEFEYMKKLTSEQLLQLDGLFKEETTNLKKMYSKYGKQKEYDEVDVAQKLFDEAKASGENMYSQLKGIDTYQKTSQVVGSSPITPKPPVVGGKKKKSRCNK